MAKRESLGRGLGALFSDLPEEGGDRSRFQFCAIEALKPNRFQPRRHFDPEEQKGLVESIRETGILQPVLVRRDGNAFEIIAGERRWRAAQAAGLKSVPVVVREVDDRQLAELTLVENLLREDLNPVEEAEGYRVLQDRFGLSQEEIAGRVGRDRSTVANFLRLLKLPQAIRDGLIRKDISAGHARALLALSTEKLQQEAFRRIRERNLNVRQAEALVKRLEKEKKEKDAPATPSSQIGNLENELSRRLLTRVRIRTGKRKGGRIEIRFHDNEDLRRLLERILGEKE
jgi:ParB family chromosome partitioning protein